MARAQHRLVLGMSFGTKEMTKYYFVYLLESMQDNFLYVGFTEDVTLRLEKHNGGQVVSTKNHRPYRMIYYEAHLSKADALRREKYLKTSKGKTTIRTMLNSYFAS